MNLWRHKAFEHGEAYSEDILLYILTEQNYDMEQSVRRLEEVTKENNKRVERFIESVVHEGVSMSNIVDSQSDTIIEILNVHRKINDLEKTNGAYALHMHRSEDRRITES